MKTILLSFFLLTVFTCCIASPQQSKGKKDTLLVLDKQQVGAIDKALSTIDSLKQDVKEGIAIVDTSSLYKTIYNDAKAGILGLANALKVGVEHVYRVLVMQQVVKSIVRLCVFLILVIVPLFYMRKVYGWAKKEELPSSEVQDAQGFAWFLFFISTPLPMIVGIFYLLFSMTTIVTGLVNPQFGAMEQIMEWVNPATNK